MAKAPIRVLAVERSGVELIDAEEASTNDAIQAGGMHSDTDLEFQDANGTITKSEIDDAINRAEVNRRATMAIALELAAISNMETNPNLNFFVDTFENVAFIDGSSSNYNHNVSQGFVELIQGGSLFTQDSTKAQFDQGTFTNTEAVVETSDGRLRRLVTDPGGFTLLEGFNSLTNITASGDSTQTINTAIENRTEGTGSLQIAIDFSGSAFTQTSTTEINLGGSVDISLDSFINIYYKKVGAGPVNYIIRVEDNTTATFDFPSATLTSTSSFAKISKSISSITGLDLTNITKIYFILNESSNGQTILDVPVSGVTEEQDVLDNSEVDQTFRLTTSQQCRRIKLRLLAESAVTEDLHIAIANFFGTTLATASLSPGAVTTAMADYFIDLSNTINLQANTTYKLILRTVQDSGGPNKDWKVLTTKNASVYADGTKFVNGADQSEDVFFTLYTPPPVENIYIDQLELEGSSVFSAAGTFLSRPVNLGSVPSALNNFTWTEILNGDDAQIRFRFADSIGNLASASFSPYYTDPTGVGNDISDVGISPATRNAYFQYEVDFPSGSTASSPRIDDVRLDYTITGGGSAEVITTVETAATVPDKFMLIWDADFGTGNIDFYVSRDDGTTWLVVASGDDGKLLDFTGPTGTLIRARAVITGNAKLNGWAMAVNKELV